MTSTRVSTCATLVVILAAYPVSVAAQQPAAAPTSRWYAGIASGWYFPIQKWPSAYVLGGGGSFLVGRQTPGRWGFELNVNMWLLSGDVRSTWDLKAGLLATWTAGRQVISPFLLAGIGADLQQDFPARTTTIGPMIPIGGGIRLTVGSNGTVFVETAYYLLFRPSSTRDIPVLTGFRIGF